MSSDHSKTPTNGIAAHPKSRRAISFTQNANPLDECLASNLSLHLAGNSILKQPNSSSRRQSTHSHLSVHYSPVTNTDEDKIENISSHSVPTMESSTWTENSRNRYRHSFKMPTHYGLHDLLQTPTGSNVFTHGR